MFNRSGIVASKGVLPSLRGDVTREAVLEYARAVSLRYLVGSKREKGVMLDEFCKTTGHHRKAAVRLLRHPPPIKPPGKGIGRPKEYGREVVEALRQVWEAGDHLCGKRLQPFIGELVEALERHAELSLEPAVRAKLLRMSAATMDRLLGPYRGVGLRRPYTTRKSPGPLKAQIPLRTFGEWSGVGPGSLQLDLVAHCGESVEQFYLHTLVGVDVATGWCEFEVVWGRGQQRVQTAIHKLRQRLPFELSQIHTDNGSEFINEVLYPWCKQRGIGFTRGRPYQKNDQAYVEQKNWSVPRRLIGYDRYASKGAYELLQRLYQYVRLYVNYFQPIGKLTGKERVGARVKKRYDPAQTPYQRVLAAGVLEEAKREALGKFYLRLNPAELRRDIDSTLEELWKLAERHRAPKPADAPQPESVGGG